MTGWRLHTRRKGDCKTEFPSSGSLAGWPFQGASGEKMNMQVWNCLTRVSAMIDDQTKSLRALRNAEECGDFACRQEKRPQGGLVLPRGLTHSWDYVFRDNQDMDGGLGVNVIKRRTVLILIQDGGWNLMIDDLLKNRLLTHG